VRHYNKVITINELLATQIKAWIYRDSDVNIIISAEGIHVIIKTQNSRDKNGFSCNMKTP